MALTEEQERLIKLVIEHEMDMGNLPPDLQTAIQKMLDGLAQRGTEIETGTPASGIDGALSFVKDGKLVNLTAFETGFIFGRMYEKKTRG